MSANHIPNRATGITPAQANAPATPAQIGCIRALLYKLGLEGQKEALVHSYTDGFTTSLSKMARMDATGLIQHLKRQDPDEVSAEKQRRKIISMAHEMGWRIAGTTKVDMRRLDAWMEKSSVLHKKLNRYQLAELPTLVTQFETVLASFIRNL